MPKEVTKDPVHVYLIQLRHHQLLSGGDALDQAKVARRSRGRLLWSALTSDFVIRRIVDTLQKLSDGTQRLEWTLDVALADMDQKARLRSMLKGHLIALRQLLRDNKSDFQIAVGRNYPMRIRRPAWRRIVMRRREAAKLVLQLKVRAEVILAFFQQLGELAGEMSQLKRELLLGQRSRSALNLGRSRVELVQLMKMTQESPATLHRRVQKVAALKSDYARQTHSLVQGNLRLVVALAKNYRNRGISFLDLIQEGNMGLMRAVEKFDPTRSPNFASYAVWWIRQAIWQAIARKRRMIKLPPAVGRVDAAQREISQQQEREPSSEEIAAVAKLSVSEVSAIQKVARGVLSLDETLDDNKETSIADLVEAPSEDVSQELDADILKERVADALQTLNDRERRIVQLRYGFTDGFARSLREVGAMLSMSHERVRQIERLAISKLQTPSLQSLALNL